MLGRVKHDDCGKEAEKGVKTDYLPTGRGRKRTIDNANVSVFRHFSNALGGCQITDTSWICQVRVSEFPWDELKFNIR